ncbi:carboxypeptidase-like regulatory domain-containing protein [Marivirga sp. S37H4]|uniref:Carboxypeptidase-like regulatory domain-containing protein n=1 Tax=Marivirga aurantiaca TaxID=2802615 RepID=A0A934X1H8_9BACT|nr:DUF5686 and carboxypeptidase regulatory-like domain-containing protein [Marivirga aurantiaca]MBK6267194.1 carboxypeptidase-like regulatory domain-containing protein [Marivirga aurantiaca]
MKYILLSIAYFLLIQNTFSSGIRGVVYDDEGQPLPYTTIYVEELGTGTSANQEAYYELNLPPGDYTFQYKFVGYETVIRKVTIGTTFLQLDIYMEKQTLLLDEVVTSAKSTDPANWMMRKAIAKSSYHRQLIDAYSGRVYVKGKGRVNSVPFYLRSMLKKEGIDTSTLIITESVSEISYKRPNQFSEKVISVYASKKNDFNASPMRFISGSFYQDEIASSISPLSSKAFQYYTFKHLGAFVDGDHLINKIKVTPKVKAPNVFEGVIQLVEDDWALYNVDVKTQIDMGIEVRIRQVYQNVNQKAWMPISYQFDVDGKIMGVGFEFKYLASVADYEITLNPALPHKIKLIDKDDPVTTKPEKEVAQSVKQLQKTKSTSEPAIVKAADLRDLMKDYQKTQADSLSKLDIVGVYNYKIDSSAYSQDSMFWHHVRPIPLSDNEIRGYAKIDSLNIVNEEKNQKDSLKNANQFSFQPLDIISGGRYTFGKEKDWKFIIYNAFFSTQYNTVEGLNVDYSIGLRKNFEMKLDSAQKIDYDYQLIKKPFILLKPTFRYAVARNNVIGKVLGKYQFQKGSVSLAGGRYVSQFNDMPAITPLINTSFTLMWEQNFMKLYEKDFVQFRFENNFSHKWRISGNVEYEERHRLFNNTEFTFIDWERGLTPNLPINADPIKEFDGQEAFTADFKVTYKPHIKFVINNGRRIAITDESPVFSLAYFKGFKGLAGSDVDFDRLEFEFRDSYEIGAKGTTYFSARTGAFLNNKSLGFMDFAHFPGNRAFITQIDPVQSYRLLDYYLYSTDSYYVQTFLYHQFRKFLITQIPATRFMGLKESFFTNYLLTSQSKNYVELGYSLDGILRFFRIEVVTNYENFRYQSTGFRVGISTTLGGNVSVEINNEE